MMNLMVLNSFEKKHLLINFESKVQLPFNVCLKRNNNVWSIRYQLSKEILNYYQIKPIQEYCIIKHIDSKNLWKNNCLELFLNTKSGKYYEFNWNFSDQFQIMSFSGYRIPLNSSEIEFKMISKTVSYQKKDLFIEISFEQITENLEISSYQISAVLLNHEEQQYWALRHDSEKADFHNEKLFFNFNE